MDWEITNDYILGKAASHLLKTKIICTIGPSSAYAATM
jgi:hypothetical protein